MHLDLTNSKITVSEARFNSFPNKPLTAPKKEHLAQLSEHLKVRAVAIKKPQLSQFGDPPQWTGGWVKILAQSTLQALQRGPIRKQHDFFALMAMIYSKRKYEHITPLLKELHWLYLSAFSSNLRCSFSVVFMVLLRHTLLTSCSRWQPWSHAEGCDPRPRPDWTSRGRDGPP